jgi:hypothetical protein
MMISFCDWSLIANVLPSGEIRSHCCIAACKPSIWWFAASTFHRQANAEFPVGIKDKCTAHRASIEA